MRGKSISASAKERLGGELSRGSGSVKPAVKKRCLNYSPLGASENVNGKRLLKKELNKEQKQQTGQFKLCCHQTGNKRV